MAKEIRGGIAPINSRPFGEPSIDDWLKWVEIPLDNSIACKYRGVWYVISWGLFGYQVSRVEKVTEMEKRPQITYQELPWQFQAELDSWRGLLHKLLVGI